MVPHSLRILVLGFAPIALTACVQTEAATAQPPSAVPTIGVDLGSSSRVPHVATLAGEARGSMSDGSMGGMSMDHGSMPGMNHGSMAGMRQGSMHGMQMDQGSMPGMIHASTGGMQMDHGSMGMSRFARGSMRTAHRGHLHAQGTGTVNSVDPAAHKVNVSHASIPAIGFPAMTMDLEVAPSVDLQAVKPGTHVNFTVEQGEGGMYVIQSITPAGGGRK